MKRLLGSMLLGLAGVAAMSATPWMSNLPDNLPLRRMSIPGAHDAATSSLTGLLAQGKCQSKNLAGLWDAGVRAFDLRPAYKSSKLSIYHGNSITGDTKVSLEDAFKTLEEKVASDPDDFAFILIHHETGADSNSSEWAGKMAEFLQQHDANIVQFSPSMTLGQARGKLVVVTRDAIDYGKAGMSDNWGDNNSDKGHSYKDGKMTGNGQTETQWLQDYYEYGSDTSLKASYVTGMLDYSTSTQYENTWVINHASGYTGSTGTNSNINTNAKDVNKAALDYLNDEANAKGRTGLFFMDFAGDDSSSYYGASLVNAIIERNNYADLALYFQDRNNWHVGAGGTSVGEATFNGVKYVESYRSDAFGTGEVMYSECDAENGDYLISFSAYGNWTPNRGGGIGSQQIYEDAKGYSQCVINDSRVDIPIYHNTGLPSEKDYYVVPVSVRNGKMRLSIENLRKGANWLTCFVASVKKIDSGTTVYNQTFTNLWDWYYTTGAQNHTIKYNDTAFNRAYENWNGDAFTGKIYTKIQLPNGKYNVSLDVRPNAVNGEKIHLYANESKTGILSTDKNTYNVEVTVKDRHLEFGVGIDEAVANWVVVDNARVTLLSLDDDAEANDLFCDPLNYFNSPSNWKKADGSSAGVPGYKDNLYVETWRTAGGDPLNGAAITSSHGGYKNGEYLLGAYFFSCYTGEDKTHEDGEYGLASLTVNGTTVDVPTHNNGNVPTPHEIYYIPVTISDGTLNISINGHGYPNWFGIDVVSLVPYEDGADLYLGKTEYNGYGHDGNIFASTMDPVPQNRSVQQNSGDFPGVRFYENWNNSPFSGDIYAMAYLPMGKYAVSLDCFAQNIGGHLEDYTLFANDRSVAKTQENAFETLTTEFTLQDKIEDMAVAQADYGSMKLYPVRYGVNAASANSGWVAVKNPTLKLLNISTVVDEIAEEQICQGDESIYSVTGVKVGEGEESFRNLAPGIYIYKGGKYLVKH